MKKHLFLLSTLLLQVASVSVFAQHSLQTGDTITGVVRDFNNGEPLFAVYITEIDSSSAVRAWASTDMNGKFSFVLVNPGDSIKFSYYRKEKLVLPIDRKNFEIRLEDDKDLPPTSWEDYETLDSREFRDIAERSKNKGLLDISVNTTDPGFYKNIRISDNTIVSESAPVKDGPKAGDTISGVVFDDNGPMMLVNVVERDSNYRIVAHCITDIEGKFSFRLVNPDHRIQVSFVGYKTVDAPIDTTFLNIRMEDAGDLPPVEIISDRVQETGPMPLPIPLREAAKDVDTIDMNLFENLGLYTIDEVLNAKIR